MQNYAKIPSKNAQDWTFMQNFGRKCHYFVLFYRQKCPDFVLLLPKTQENKTFGNQENKTFSSKLS